jgi:hypothetical protein
VLVCSRRQLRLWRFGRNLCAQSLNRDAERCTLYLRSDRTFTEELVRAGSVQKAQGTWHRYGESHVSFSRELLTISGEDVNVDGEAHGEFSDRAVDGAAIARGYCAPASYWKRQKVAKQRMTQAAMPT